MKILVLGAGVIGSVYAGHLWRAGHDVVLLARGRRLEDLNTHGLILADALSGRREVLPVPSIGAPTAGDRFDVVMVAVRWDQLRDTVPILTGPTTDCDVLFFGNVAGRQADLRSALGRRVLFGFPAVGGVAEGPLVRYVVIGPQKTMLGESEGTTTARVARLQGVLTGAGFRTRVSHDIDGWLLGHAAFVVPIAFALARAGGDASALALDPGTLRLMVAATRQTFVALSAAGAVELPANLRALYRLPMPVVVRYWRRVMAGPRGELWFAAHTRAAPQEMRSLAVQVQAALRRTGLPAPDLERLLAGSA